MTNAIAITPFEAEFSYRDGMQLRWVPCTVHGIQTDSDTLNPPQLICIAKGEDGMIGALTLTSVRLPEPYYPRRPSA